MTTILHHLLPNKSVPDRLFKVADDLFATDKAAAMDALFAVLVCEIGTDGVIKHAKRMQASLRGGDAP